MKMHRAQPKLFADRPAFPSEFRLRPELLDRGEERRLLQELERLDFQPFNFHGFLGKRRVISFGWRYAFDGTGLTKAEEIPEFILPFREKAAAAFGLVPAELEQVLLIEYPPGSTIGWHKDRPVFGRVIGISLLSACTFRFRRKTGGGWDRRSLVLEPRSAYLLEGEVRNDWEHSIPTVPELRYAITMRTMRDKR
jgi:alkylated DNA repair dioxygenase AlkB